MNRDLYTGLAPSSAVSYRRHLADWDRWLTETDAPFDSIAERDDTIARYLAHRHDSGLSPAYINLGIAAIRRRAKYNDEPDPAGWRTEQQLKAINRSGRDRGNGQVAPFTWSQVDQAATMLLEQRCIIGVRNAAMIRLGSDAALRISELRNAEVGHIDFRSDGTARFRIAHSKTDPTGRGEWKFLGTETAAALSAWLERHPWQDEPDAPLFTPISKWGGAIAGKLSTQSVRYTIQKAAELAGVEGRVSGHSLRVGCAISLARRGATTAEIMRVCRWRNEALALHYIGGESAARDAVARLRYGN